MKKCARTARADSNKQDHDKSDVKKLSYYSINKHRALLIVYALLCLLLAVVVCIIVLRLLFGFFGLIPILGLGTEGTDYSYLADFLGGLIGIVIGFLSDAIFISRWQHLKRYKSLLNLLNTELEKVKNIIKYVWGIGSITSEKNDDNKILNILREAGLINGEDAVESPDKIDRAKEALEYFQVDKKEMYDKLFDALKAVYSESKITGKMQKKVIMHNDGSEVTLTEIRSYFQQFNDEINNKDKENNGKKNTYDFNILNKALSLCLALDANKIIKISTPILESVVTSADGIATFYNLPRYTIWSEEQGNFARELQDFLQTLNSLEENFRTKESWEFFLISKNLVDRIENFQRNTDLSYYQEDVYEYLESFVYSLRKELREKNLNDDEMLKKLLLEREYCRLKIKELKKLKDRKHTINKSYIRYFIRFEYADKTNKTSSHTRVLIDGQNRAILKRTVLRFEKVKYEKTDFLYLLDTKKEIDYAQDFLGSVHFQEDRNLQKHLPSDFAFSSKYFSKGTSDVIFDKTEIKLDTKSADSCLNELNGIKSALDEPLKLFSEIYKDVITVIPRKYSGDIKTKSQGKLTVLDNQLLSGAIVKLVNRCYNKNKQRGETILKLVGPIGSYKNRLLQYIYIKLKILKKDIPIFYIDISKYENEFGKDKIDSELATIREIVGDFSANGKSIQPLFIIDNIRTFQCGINYIYKLVNGFLHDEIKNYKLIIGCDTLYTFNLNQEEEIPFHDKSSVTTFNISSMNLTREKESLEFIINSLKLDGKSADINDAKKIRDRLLELNFYTMDAYWLLKVIKHTDNLSNKVKNILDLYDNWLYKYTPEMGKQQYDSLAESVYLFEYESQHFDTLQLCNNSWKLAREHRSMIDYLVARQYVVLLRKIILPKDAYTVIQNLGGRLNLFLPKSINRFVVCELSKNDLHNLILFCKSHIDLIRQYPKFECQVTYLLRVLGKEYLGCQSESVKVLNLMLNEAVSNSADGHCNNAEIRQQLFVNRCIVIGLGYLGESNNFLEYLKTIIPGNSLYNPIADDINRAFHLDYYGDTYKCLDMNGDFTNYTDDKEVGVNALRKLQIDIRGKIVNYMGENFDDGQKAILILQMVTYCSLMKARDYEFQSFIIKEDFIKPIIENIKNLALKVQQLSFQDTWFNEENGYISEFLLNVFKEVYNKLKLCP